MPRLDKRRVLEVVDELEARYGGRLDDTTRRRLDRWRHDADRGYVTIAALDRLFTNHYGRPDLVSRLIDEANIGAA